MKPPPSSALPRVRQILTAVLVLAVFLLVALLVPMSAQASGGDTTVVSSRQYSRTDPPRTQKVLAEETWDNQPLGSVSNARMDSWFPQAQNVPNARFRGKWDHLPHSYCSWSVINAPGRSGNALRIPIKGGSTSQGGDGGYPGCQFILRFAEKGVSEAYFEYDIMFRGSGGRDFPFNKPTGKLPGLGHLVPPGPWGHNDVRTNRPPMHSIRDFPLDTGASFRRQWDQGGKASDFPYFYNVKRDNWQNYNDAARVPLMWANPPATGSNANRQGQGHNLLQSGRWHTFRQYVKLNDPGRKNGQIKSWLDGVLVNDRRLNNDGHGMQFRATDTYGINQVLAYWYMGGAQNDPKFYPDYDVDFLMANMTVWTQ